MLAAILALMIGVCSAQSGPPTTAELLEKGIYTEETIGDLESAIQIYEQVIQKATSERPYAAKALYRISVCYRKSGDDARADEALRELVLKYGDQSDLVSLARAQMKEEVEEPDLRLDPAPWEDGEELHLTFRFPGGDRPLGKIVSAVQNDRVDGRMVARLQLRRLFPGNQGVSNVVVDMDDFAPIETRVRHTVFGRIDAVFGDKQIELFRPNDDEPQVVTASSRAYENDSVMHLFRRLPLRLGYNATVPIFASITGQFIGLTIDVSEIDTLEVPAGTFPCYRLDTNINQTLWISTGPERYAVKAEMGGVAGELEKITSRRRDQAIDYETERLAFHVPSDWIVFDQGKRNTTEQTVSMQDPSGVGTAVIKSWSVLPSDDQALEDMVEEVIKDNVEKYGTYGLREGSPWKGRVSDQPSLHYLADFKLQDRPLVQYRVFVKTPDTWVKIIFVLPSEALTERREEMDVIIQSLKFR